MKIVKIIALKMNNKKYDDENIKEESLKMKPQHDQLNKFDKKNIFFFFEFGFVVILGMLSTINNMIKQFFINKS